ncbi:MAG: hypothetical protein KDK99_03360 [Verrucomicrobiales bacterium]|nr:hypothetical protein [Verrucomicrobiales bacterium]
MNTDLILRLAFFALLLSSCSHWKKPKDIVYDEDLQGTLDIPSYTRNALDGWPEGRKLDPQDSSRVRFPDSIHTYHVGRLPSMDRREMHEAHSVYRVEQDAHWDQRLPATPMRSSGVILGIREPSSNPIPDDHVIANERSRQLRLSQALEEQLALIREQQGKLETFLASAPDKNKTIEQLQQQRSQTETQLKTLQAESEQLKRELQEYKDREAIREATMRRSKPQS